MTGGRLFCENMKKMFQEYAKEGNNFSIRAISNIPYIEYYGFTKEENIEVVEQCADVMRTSWQNHGAEVCITYRMDDRNKETKYSKRTGGEVSVTANEEMIAAANREGALVIVSMHACPRGYNHPNLNGFSLQDVSMFCVNPGIRLMVVINTNGDISYLLRPRQLDLQEILKNDILAEYPDFEKDVVAWEETHDVPWGVADIITAAPIRIKTAGLVLNDLVNAGILYKPYNEKKPLIPDFPEMPKDNGDGENPTIYPYTLPKDILGVEKYGYYDEEDSYTWSNGPEGR